jgi:poly-gamma-glutamate biosynthesis protein PgsC/CapC
MYLSDIYIALILGTVLSLLFVEITGFLPAGIVVPGYLALVVHQPLFILITFLISLITYLIVVFGIEKITLLYGKRKFAAMILVAIIVKIALHYIFPTLPTGLSELSALGVIIPGLIANTIQRQGVIPTIGSTTLLTALTYSGIFAYHIFY